MPNEDSNQPVYSQSLIRVVVRMKKFYTYLAILNEPTGDTGQTAPMRRLICSCARRIFTKVRSMTSWLMCVDVKHAPSFHKLQTIFENFTIYFDLVLRRILIS